jgi:hypothetical protein
MHASRASSAPIRRLRSTATSRRTPTPRRT